MQAVDEAVRLIRNNFNSSEYSLDGHYSDEEVESAEKILNIKFPKSYREFLKKYGNVDVGSLSVMGLSRYNYQNSGYGGLVSCTLSDRQNFSQPNHIISLYDIGEGTTYALDLSQMNENNECPVVYWPIGGYEMTPILEVVAPDFGTWFLDMVKERIKWKQEESLIS
jgi:hypothetical protein